jgi:hypothetical protein
MSVEQKRRGVVVSFDAFAGLGDIRDEEGTVWPFHCVSLVDGTRQIDVGIQVEFTTRFHVKRDEAFQIEKK